MEFIITIIIAYLIVLFGENKKKEEENERKAEEIAAKKKLAFDVAQREEAKVIANRARTTAKVKVFKERVRKENIKEPPSWIGNLNEGSTQEIFNKALVYYKNGSYIEAVKLFRKAAEQGLDVAQYSLGIMIADGNEIVQSDTEAVKWFRKAAEQGLAEAQCELGIRYNNGVGVLKDVSKSVVWYKKSAEQEYPRALVNLGMMYFKSDVINHDRVEAATLFRQAAEQGFAAGQYKAVTLFRQAAEQGFAAGQYSLGVMFAKGYGVNKSNDEAVMWFRKAAEQGLAEAQYRLANTVHERDEKLYWYRKAAEQGLAEAQYNLHAIYSQGFLIPKNSIEEAKWKRKAAEQGFVSYEQYGLVEIYESEDFNHIENLKSIDVSSGVISDKNERKAIGPLETLIVERNIELLVHFTRYENLESILENGIVTRESLINLAQEYIVNDDMRLDGHPDSISLSISFPNYKMFYKYRMSEDAKGWVVLVLEPSILWRYKCAFCKHNAADSRISRQDINNLMGVEALKEMFIDDPECTRSEQRLKSYDATDPQAEVLMFDDIPTKFIQSVYFEDEKLFSHVKNKHKHHSTKHIEYVMNKEYFNSREYVR